MDVRIESLSIDGFKNVRHGSFTMPEALYGRSSSDILAIFGQNGSGKSTAIEALATLYYILSARALSGRIRELVNVDKTEAELSISFILEGRKHLRVRYTVRIGGSESVSILSERITVAESGERSSTVFWDEKGRIYGKPRQLKKEEAESAIADAKKKKISVFFSNNCFTHSIDNKLVKKAIDEISAYAKTSFIVINPRNRKYDKDILHISYLRMSGRRKIKGRLDINLASPFSLKREEEANLLDTIENINTVLLTLIPDMKISISKLEDGSIELFSDKNGLPIPLRSESEGIIKLISIISVLIFVYNERGSALIIDELDASIYEYLLGEIMEVFRNGAAGQLIFTSHNLRILEMIDKRSLIFSTNNPDQKYVRLPDSIPDTTNLRNYYLRTVLLADDESSLSSGTDPHDIARALRKAWRHE